MMVRNETELEVPSGKMKKIARQVLASEGREGCDLFLLLATGARMRTLNEAYRGAGYTPNVLAFRAEPFDFEKGGEIGELGEVVLCPEKIALRAERQGVAFDEALAFFLVHGLLHLLGYTHEGREDTEAMKKREKKHLAAARDILSRS